MTIEINEPNSHRTPKTNVIGVANRFGQRQIWRRCPRCIGGNTYQERNGKHVCIQCGCTYYLGHYAKSTQQ